MITTPILQKHKTLIISILFLVFTSMIYGFGSYEETLSFSTSQSTFSVNHSLDSAFSTSSTVTINQKLTPVNGGGTFASQTTAIVVFSAGNSGNCENRTAENSYGDTIEYNLYLNDSNPNHTPLKDASTYQSSPDGMVNTFSAVWVGSSIISTDADFAYSLEIPEDQFVPPGIYSDVIQLDLYDTDLSGSPEETEMIYINITVDKFTDIRIADAGAGYDPSSSGYSMDFGTLDPGESLVAEIGAKANTSYSIQTYSTNGGRMKYIAPPDIEAYVPYSIMVDTNTFTSIPDISSAPLEIISNAPSTPETGTTYALSVVIGDTTWVPAGDYQDNLLFEITAN